MPHNRRNYNKTHSIALSGLLFALAMALSFIEGTLVIPGLLPGMKLGLANIVVMYALFFMGPKQALVLDVLKAFFVFLVSGWTAGFLSLFFRQKVLLFHISGGTTDLLLCNEVKEITTLGTSSDLYAGQAVDRVGVKLGFGFPAGVEVSRLAALCEEPIKPRSSVKGMQCSLSGLENQCNALLNEGKTPEYVCKYCLLCVADTVVKMTKAAQKEYPGLPVVCAGGVMSSDIIRAWVQQRLPQVYFVPGQYSSDNAIGVSILAAQGAGLWLK